MDSGAIETAPSGTVHLDTVRALHQTVVSLRTALELSKNELKLLKQKYEEHSNCIEYADIIEKLTIENHILRRKIIDTDGKDQDAANIQNIKLQVTYSPRSHYDGSDVVITTATTDAQSTVEVLDKDTNECNLDYCSTEKLNKLAEAHSNILRVPEHLEGSDNSEGQSGSQYLEAQSDQPHTQLDDIHSFSVIDEAVEVNSTEQSLPKESPGTLVEEQSEIASLTRDSDYHPSFKTKLELLSKFDVRIKVRSLRAGAVLSSSTSDSGSEDKKDTKKFEKESTDSKTSFHFEERREHFENTEDLKGNRIKFKSVSTDNIKMAVPNEADVKSKVDKFDVQVKITSEENLVVKENFERNRRKDTLNLEVDDLSLRSLSEGDNSVFSEGVVTPLDPSGAVGLEEKIEQAVSDNESEEVDDIELIFTTDESKDMSSNLQEDLVSIRETDQWGPSSASAHSTPVLIKFHTLDPDFQPRGEAIDNTVENNENTNETALKIKRVSLPNDKEIRHVAFNPRGGLELPGRGILKSCDNRSDNMLYKKSPNTSTRRLDSVDSLTCEYNRGYSLDTKSSSFELGSSMDILTRGDSTDNFAKYNHLGHRFSVFAESDISKCGISEDDLLGNLNVRRNTCPNPFQYRPPPYRSASRQSGPFKAGRVRPVLRDSTSARRESAAQTDVCALPDRWTSDGYLAHKIPAILTTPQPPPPRLAAPCKPRDDPRRVLLSDIGFTSMVPELSRSADPLWCLARRQADSSPAGSTSKFLSRGASYQSPRTSLDRSTEWTPSAMYLPPNKESRLWRSSLPDVRDDTDELVAEADAFLRASIDNLKGLGSIDNLGTADMDLVERGTPYIPAEPRHLRLGHRVKVITPHGRVAVGRVRYVGLAGATAATSAIMVGAEFPHSRHPGLPRNDGVYRGRRYFVTAKHWTALFVPFAKVVMAWAN